MAENKVISIEDGWNIEDERSISFAPQLSIDEQNIYIYSEKELNDLEVIIKGSLGNVIYYNVTTVSGYTTYPILIDNWNKGKYTIQIKKGSSFICRGLSVIELITFLPSCQEQCSYVGI